MLPNVDRGKVFQDALIQINEIIEEDKLAAGDRLPSERELADRLKIGRSSIREALRALELLGLITTRRGEGTFIGESTSHRLVEILASFILREEQSKQDLSEVHVLIGTDAAELAALRRTDLNVTELHQCLSTIKQHMDHKRFVPQEHYVQFHRFVLKASQNALLYRIWEPLSQFSASVYERRLGSVHEQKTYDGLYRIFSAISDKDSEAAGTAMREHLMQQAGIGI